MVCDIRKKFTSTAALLFRSPISSVFLTCFQHKTSSFRSFPPKISEVHAETKPLSGSPRLVRPDISLNFTRMSFSQVSRSGREDIQKGRRVQVLSSSDLIRSESWSQCTVMLLLEVECEDVRLLNTPIWSLLNQSPNDVTCRTLPTFQKAFWKEPSWCYTSLLATIPFHPTSLPFSFCISHPGTLYLPHQLLLLLLQFFLFPCLSSCSFCCHVKPEKSCFSGSLSCVQVKGNPTSPCFSLFCSSSLCPFPLLAMKGNEGVWLKVSWNIR